MLETARLRRVLAALRWGSAILVVCAQPHPRQPRQGLETGVGPSRKASISLADVSAGQRCGWEHLLDSSCIPWRR